MKTISMDDFHKQGYLQELNRQFLHPLGLSLAVKINEKKQREFFTIYDHRDSKDNLTFRPGLLSDKKKAFVESEQEERGQVRLQRLGYVVQPVES